MQGLGFPVVATSGNRASEPICIDESTAIVQLKGIADCFLVHNRPIVRPVDDSVMALVENTPLWLRRSRGYAPLPMTVTPELGQYCSDKLESFSLHSPTSTPPTLPTLPTLS